MSIAEPISDLQYGRGNWLDYVSNWRQKDASFLQERSILRYATAAARTTDWGVTPRAGQVTYRSEGGVDRLEMYSSLRSAWVNILLSQFLAMPKDDGIGVTLSHIGAAGKGITLGPSNVIMDLPVNAYNGLLTADASGVGVKTTAMKQALLSTNATELVSDTIVSVPGLHLTAGTLDATGRPATVGALTAVSATIPNITLTGTLSGGGAINGTSANIGGVLLGTNKVTATVGLLSNSGHIYGDGTGAVIRHSNDTGPYIYVGASGGSWNGPPPGGNIFDFYGTVRLMSNNVMQYLYAGNGASANIAPSIYSASDPGAANFPDGTIWIS